jgi:hypothetical protein
MKTIASCFKKNSSRLTLLHCSTHVVVLQQAARVGCVVPAEVTAARRAAPGEPFDISAHPRVVSAVCRHLW